MPLRWKISVSTADQRDLSAHVRANITSVRANAEEGSVAMSSLVVDDPDGTLDIPALKDIYGQETESTLPTFYRGTVADRTVSRGEADTSFRTGAARQWTVQMADQNERLSRRFLLGTDANRPAETDVARIQYVMGSPEMSTVGITSSTYISTSGPIAMDAADYRGQTVLSLIDDCAQASGKNYWVMHREDLGAGVFGLWYDFDTSTAYASPIGISDVLSDIDSVTTFAASRDTTLTRDPSRVYSGVYLPFSGGAVYQQQASTASNFQARDTTSYSANVKTVAKADARAIRYLTDIDTEEDRITTSIIVPNAQVNDLREGHLVSARFSHLPGYETATSCRVLNRTVSQVSEEFYRIEMELSPAITAPVGAEFDVLYLGPVTYDYYVIPGTGSLDLSLASGPLAPDTPEYVTDGSDTTRGFYPTRGGVYGYGDPALRFTVTLAQSYLVSSLLVNIYPGLPPTETSFWDGASWVTVGTPGYGLAGALSTGWVLEDVVNRREWRLTFSTPKWMSRVRIGQWQYSTSPGGGYWGTTAWSVYALEAWGRG